MLKYELVRKKVYNLEKMIRYVYCKVKNLTNIHNEFDGLQGGEQWQYYHLTEEQYNCVVENCTNDNIGTWT